MNRRRPSLLALPAGVKLADFLFEPDKEEKQAFRNDRRRRGRLDKLKSLKSKWDAEDLAATRRRVKELEAVVAADREFVAREAENEERRMAAEAQTKKIVDYYINSEHKALLARAARAGREINADIVKAERKELERRGLVRGKRR